MPFQTFSLWTQNRGDRREIGAADIVATARLPVKINSSVLYPKSFGYWNLSKAIQDVVPTESRLNVFKQSDIPRIYVFFGNSSIAAMHGMNMIFKAIQCLSKGHRSSNVRRCCKFLQQP